MCYQLEAVCTHARVCLCPSDDIVLDPGYWRNAYAVREGVARLGPTRPHTNFTISSGVIGTCLASSPWHCALSHPVCTSCNRCIDALVQHRLLVMLPVVLLSRLLTTWHFGSGTIVLTGQSLALSSRLAHWSHASMPCQGTSSSQLGTHPTHPSTPCTASTTS